MRLTFQQVLYIFVDEYERLVVVACIQVSKVKKCMEARNTHLTLNIQVLAGIHIEWILFTNFAN